MVTNWEEIVSEQLEKIHNSGLLKESELKIGAVYGEGSDKEVLTKKLYSILSSFYNYEVMFIEPNGCCGESITLKKLSEFSKENLEFNHILYIHTKGVTQYSSERENPVREWRRMMEYFLIDNWYKCIEKLKEGFDCCGINYQNHAGNVKGETRMIQIFNGNFFWVNSDYLRKLDETILFEHRYSAENWVLSEVHNYYSFINVPASFDLYYNIFEGYK